MLAGGRERADGDREHEHGALADAQQQPEDAPGAPPVVAPIPGAASAQHAAATSVERGDGEAAAPTASFHTVHFEPIVTM